MEYLLFTYNFTRGIQFLINSVVVLYKIKETKGKNMGVMIPFLNIMSISNSERRWLLG